MQLCKVWTFWCSSTSISHFVAKAFENFACMKAKFNDDDNEQDPDRSKMANV